MVVQAADYLRELLGGDLVGLDVSPELFYGVEGCRWFASLLQ